MNQEGKKSPMYVEVLNDGDDSSDDISDVIIIEDEDEDEDIEDEDGDGGMKVFLQLTKTMKSAMIMLTIRIRRTSPIEFPRRNVQVLRRGSRRAAQIESESFQHVKNAYGTR